MEHLIESVRKYPCLWQVDSADYKDNEIKEAAWVEVFNECDFPSVLEVKNLWKKLRDSHRQAINKKKTSTGQAATPKFTWKYEQQMQFLLPHMKNRPTQTNIQVEDQTAQQEDLLLQDPASGIQIKKNKTIHTILEEEQNRREKRATERMRFRNQLLENTCKTVGVAANKTSALDKFFLSMCETTSELPEFLQMRVQRQVFNVVMEAKEQHLLQASSSLGNSQRESMADHGEGTMVHRFSGSTPFQLQKPGNDAHNSSRTNSSQSSYYLSPQFDLVSPASNRPESIASPTEKSPPNMDICSYLNSYDFNLES